jgi:NADP-dependent 3-hydroxy acid dehydrogenase YdfG
VPSGSRLAERVIVITGAASGFGRLVAEAAAERGASVVGGDIDEAALAQTFGALSGRGLAAAWRAVDVADPGQMNALAALAVERFGRIDVLINNAGVMPLAFFSDHAAAAPAWSKAIDVNIKGVVNGVAAVYDQMIAQGRGHVVNISSTYGNAPTEGAGVYAATKTAVNMLSESLRIEGQGKIKVSVVRPTGVPATGLAKSIVNMRATIGMLGHHAADAGAKMKQLMSNGLPPQHADPDQIGYFALDPQIVADAILYVVDQPWGVSISDLTVRAAGEPYLL